MPVQKEIKKGKVTLNFNENLFLVALISEMRVVKFQSMLAVQCQVNNVALTWFFHFTQGQNIIKICKRCY